MAANVEDPPSMLVAIAAVAHVAGLILVTVPAIQ